MRIGQVNNIEVKVHWCFFLIAGIFIAAGMGKQVGVVFFSVILHEAAHIVMAKYCGYRVEAVELLPFGGVAKINRFGASDKKTIFAVAAAGPIASLLIAGGSVMGTLLGMEQMRLVAQINFTLGLFNLLPAFPLDGGHIFRAFCRCFMPYREATRLLAIMSGIVCLGLLGKLGYDFVFTQCFNVSYAVMSLFILAATKQEVKASEFHAVKVMAYKKDDLRRSGYMEATYYAVERKMKMKAMTRMFSAEKYTMIIVLDETHRICATCTEMEVWEAIAEKGLGVSFGDLFPQN